MIPKGTKIQTQRGRRYEIAEHVGKTESGELYQARMAPEKQFVAIEFITPKYTFVAEVVGCLRETQLASLNHGHIVKTVALDVYQGHPMIVTEYMAGGTLRKRLSSKGAISEQDALRVVRDVASALVHLEQHHIVHRNVQPVNIMLTAQGRAKLTGFGAAKLPSFAGVPALPENLLPADFAHSLTIIKGHPGTIPYMSPEQATGRELDTRSDIYSLGVCLFEMLTGVCPFQPNRSLQPAQSRHELLTRIVKQAPSDPRKRRKNLSKQTAALVLKMLAKDPNQRFSRAGDLVKTIGRILEGLAQGDAGPTHPLERNELAGIFEALAEPTITRRALVAGEIIGAPKALRE